MEFLIEMIQFQYGVSAVPAENSKCGQGSIGFIREVREGDLALIILPHGGDEHEIMQFPRGSLRPVRRGPLL